MQHKILHSKIRKIARLGVLVLAIAAIPTCVYALQNKAMGRLSGDIEVYKASAERLEADIRLLQDKNEGIVPYDEVTVAVDEPDKVAFAGGSVAFRIPSDWEIAEPTRYTTHCGGGGSKSGAVLCYGVAEVLPVRLNNADPITRYSATVSVFENDGGLDAKEWYEEAYGGYKESEQGCPQCIPKIHEPKEWSDNLYTAYTFTAQTDVSTGADQGDYALVVYVFTHDKLAIVAQSKVVYSIGDEVYDYREYTDDVRELAGSITFID